jgi:hypothetical protein
MRECQIHIRLPRLVDVLMRSGSLRTRISYENMLEHNASAIQNGLQQRTLDHEPSIVTNDTATPKTGALDQKALNWSESTTAGEEKPVDRLSTRQRKISRVLTVVKSSIRVQWTSIIAVLMKSLDNLATCWAGQRSESGRKSSSVIFCAPCVTESGITPRFRGDDFRWPH